MKKNLIKKLAEFSFRNGSVDKKITNFALLKLSKSDLKTYLFYYKKELGKNAVLVKTSDRVDKITEQKLKEIFKNKQINYIIDESLGAGMYIKSDNDVIDASIKGLIEQAIMSVKKEI